MKLEFDNVTKRFGATAAVVDLSLAIEPGELFFLLGPSGCGKTTCLRMTAGFDRPDAGRILFDGRDTAALPPHKRNAGMVFQHYALFPHLTVRGNVDYGLRFRSLPRPDRAARVDEIMRALRITELADRLPAQLSGGQQQRAALARALVIQPDILLLDEPLSNLDARLRTEMREEIRRVHEMFRNTALYVTHDQEEALTLADRIAVMNAGRVIQVGGPEEIYSRPRNAFVANFVGESNVIAGRVAGVDSNGYLKLETPFGEALVAGSGAAAQTGEVEFSILPEHLAVRPGDKPPAERPWSLFAWRMQAVESVFSGSVTRAVFKGEAGGAIRAKIPVGAAAPGKDGGAWWVGFDPEKAVILEKDA